MGEWKKVLISSFLQNRPQRYDPGDLAIQNLKRLEKIDFDGNIHLSDKPTKTDMIIIQPGDLVISGINVAKGAIAVYEGLEPITATIHYSSYKFDPDKIDIQYFKRFLKSDSFLKALKEQVRGGIKTEIKAKDFLPIQINLPNIDLQCKINSYFNSFDQELSDLYQELINQSDYLSFLRKIILQEAIEGKLTADWRKQNPVRKGDPNTDAEALLEKIKQEKQKMIAKGKIKNEKPLEPIKPEEIPFELPEGWVWTRLGEITENITSGSRNWRNFYSANGASFIRSQDIKFDRLEYDNRVFVNVIGNEEGSRTKVQSGDWLITITGGNVGRCAYLVDDPGLAYVNQHVALMRPVELNIGRFGHLWLTAEYGGRGLLGKSIYGDKPGLNLDQLRTLICPLPSLVEQQVIVNQVDKFLNILDGLESYVKNRKNYVEELMQAILREAFERRAIRMNIPKKLLN